MPRKENLKAKTWERDRRNRMNGYFKNLAELLPPQLEGRKRNKIDILIHASKYIKDLHSRTDELFDARASEAHKEELARLKRLVAQLISRTQLLSDLLKNAGITVPAEPALEKISPLKWSNKINVVSELKDSDKAETNKRREKKKERNASNTLRTNLKKKAVKIKRTEKQPVHNKCFPEKSNCTNEDQENHVSNGSSEKSDKEDKSSSSNEESTTNNTSVKVIPPKQDIKNHKKVKRKKKITPKKTTPKETAEVNNFPSGTLVFSGGKIMPMVTPIQSLTSNIIVNAQSRPTNPIVLNNTQQGSMIVVQPLQTNHFQTVSTMQTLTLNTVPNIQTNMLINPQDWAKNVKTIINSSKIGGTKGILPKIKEVTETTMTYKVPIPAIHKEKSETKNEIKAVSVNEKSSKVKNNSKNVKNNRSTSNEVQNDSKNSKEVMNGNTWKNKSNVNKQVLKRNSNVIHETKKKKIKLNENKNKNKEIKTKTTLDNTVTCKSIENLKQVIEKIGDDSSYMKNQLNSSAINNSKLMSKEEKDENNLLNESNNMSLNVDKCQDKESNLLTEFVDDKKSPNANQNSDDSKIISEKEISSARTITEQMQADFSEKMTNEISENINKNHLITSTEVATELQIEKSTSTTEKSDIQLSNIECNIDENIMLSSETNQNCNIEAKLDNILQSNSQNEITDEQISSENNKIFLNLDTNTTTTMKLEDSENKIDSISTSSALKVSMEDESLKLKNTKDDQNMIKTISYSPSNSFVPINHKSDSLHSDLSNDIFASLQVPSSSNNSESVSPTAAFLMAFPIVSSVSGKAEVLEDEMKDDFKYNSQTPPMLLQIGTIEPNNFKINSKTSVSDNLEIVESSGIHVQSQVKSSTESVMTNSASVTTPAKNLPRVISSQILTESYKIIPTSSEQISRQITTETNNSLENNSLQTNSSNQTENLNINRSINNTIQNYPLESKPQPNFNYTKDVSLTSISNSMANDILNKYISTTSLPTNTMVSESSSKYNSASQYITQDCQTTVSNCAKENVNRNSSQFNFPCQSTNDIPTEKDLCKLQICPMESFTERSIEYSARNKESSFSNTTIQTTISEPLNKNIPISINQEKSSKVPMQSNQNLSSNNISSNNISSNNFHSIKKLESKDVSNNSDTNNIYHKKPNDISNSNSFTGSCDNKINKKMVTTSSQSNSSGQKVASSRSNITYSQQSEVSYIVTSNYEENSITRSTTTVASTTSNFSILSWTTFSPLSSNTSNFPQYDQAPLSTEIPKPICENFNYLPLPKENVSMSSALPQTSYSSANPQIPSFDKTKTKVSQDQQKRSYSDLNKSRNNMRLSQTVPVQKSPRAQPQIQPSIPNSDYKYSTDNKNKYKYPADMDYGQNNYSSGIDLIPQLQHQQQSQQSQQNQSSNSKGSSNQSLQSLKSDKSNYMLPDYDSHTNFTSDSNNIQPRYPSNHDGYASTNFKYSEKSQPIHSKYQPTSQVPTSTLHHENTLYSNKHLSQQHQPQSNQSKTKTDQTSQIQPVQPQQQIHQQHTVKPPINWMMTPEIKHNSNITDIILPPIGKELDFCQNNIFSQTPSYNQTSTNHQFYNNYDMTTHTFPNIQVLPSEPKRNMDTTYYPSEQTFSWSPTKNLSQTNEQNQSLKNIETSTMPTLVGDLALDNNIPDKQNFLFSQMPVRSSTNELGKELLKNKETGAVPNRDYQTVGNNQQHSSHGMPFLSVSQLVDHEKVEKNPHQPTHNTTNHHSNNTHHHHQHHQPQQQQQQQQPQHPPRKQRKSNSSPRASNKRQMDMRQKHTTHNHSDQIQRHHEEPKTSSTTSSFTDTSYQQQPQQQHQQQKYNQQNNDVQWRSRNCKSNYTAEALIGTNTNHTDNHHTEKNLPKYSSNYSQNKFSGPLSSDPMAINYFPNVEDPSSGYGQVMNQNFNHSYAYSSNANIYPSSNFITNISNTSTNYMMSLHENTPDYLESNNFLLPPNVSTTSITTPLLTNMTDGVKNHHHSHHQPYVPSKHQNCDKRLYFSQQKKNKRKVDSSSSSASTTTPVQNFDFPLSGISSPLDDYHHASTFLPPPNPLYQTNQPNMYTKSTLPPPPPPPPPSTVSASAPPPPPSSSSATVTGNPTSMAMTQHHPPGTSLTNFNLSTIFPEINDKVAGYKSSTNGHASGITQSTSHTSTSYSQRTNYTDPLGQMSQTSETSTHFNNTGSR